MDIVVLGAGALGSLFGGYLALSGHHVTLIGRQNAHMEAMQNRGLEISGIRGHHVVTQNLTSGWNPESVHGADVLIIAVKANDSLKALASVSHLVGHVESVLSLQNSVTKDDLLLETFGPEATVGAATIEAAAISSPGHVRNGLTVPVTLYLGELDNRASSRLSKLVDAFNEADLGTKAATDIKQVQWEKLAQICLANAFTVPALSGLPSAGQHDAMGIREGAEFYADLASELLGVYGGMGYEAQDFFAPLSRLKELVGLDFDSAVELLLRRSEERRRTAKRGQPPIRSSLFGDLERGRVTEVEQIFIPFLDEAAKQGMNVPVLRTAYRNIRVIEALTIRDGGLCRQQTAPE